MAKILRSFYIFFLAVVVSACAVQNNPGEASGVAQFDEAPMDSVAREEYLRGFVLLNALGDEGAPTETHTGTSPFGVLLRMPKSGRVSACSAAHVRPGKVLTNAHCVVGHRSLAAGGFFLVFYDKHGRKLHLPVEGFEYVGSPKADDLAVLNLSPDAAAKWDVLSGVISNRREPHYINVWAFDPIEPGSSSAARYSRGMVFRPRQCLASRRLPQLNGLRGNGEKEDLLRVTEAKESLHFFLDGCDRALGHGNSGAIVTAGAGMEEILGVYHWGIKPTGGSAYRYSQLEYVGNDGARKVLHGKDEQEIFGVGFSLANFKL